MRSTRWGLYLDDLPSNVRLLWRVVAYLLGG